MKFDMFQFTKAFSVESMIISKSCPSGAKWSERVVPAAGPAEVRSGAEAAGAPRGPSQGLHHQGGAAPGLLIGLQLPPEHSVRPQPVQHPQQAVTANR